MSDIIAIDIVLVPPQEIIDLASRLNARYSDTNRYASFADGYVPHISLAMRSIATEDLTKLKNDIAKLCAEMQPLKLKIKENRQFMLREKIMFDLPIEQNEDLLALQKKCMDIAMQYEKYPAEPNMFSEPEKVDEKTLSWVDKFPNSKGVFDAHITLGAGEPPKDFEAMSFIVDTVGIFQIGPYCTCKNELARFTLK